MTITVGFIGLGQMGGALARNIIRAGYDLSVFDLRQEAIDAFVNMGSRAASSVAELAGRVDLLCTCVVNDRQVQDLFLGPGGILESAHPGLVCTVHSTVFPKTVIDLARAAEERSVHIVDAPVSRVGNGTVTVILGGRQDPIDLVKSVMASQGPNVFVAGEVGKPQVIKLANNMMGMGNHMIAMEAVKFAEAMGVDRETVLEIVRVGVGDSWSARHFDLYERLPFEHTLGGTEEFPHAMTKDLRIAVSMALEKNTYLPVTSLCSQLMPSVLIEMWREPKEINSSKDT